MDLTVGGMGPHWDMLSRGGRGQFPALCLRGSLWCCLSRMAVEGRDKGTGGTMVGAWSGLGKAEAVGSSYVQKAEPIGLTCSLEVVTMCRPMALAMEGHGCPQLTWEDHKEQVLS